FQGAQRFSLADHQRGFGDLRRARERLEHRRLRKFFSFASRGCVAIGKCDVCCSSVISSAGRNLRSLTFVRDDNWMLRRTPTQSPTGEDKDGPPWTGRQQCFAGVDACHSSAYGGETGKLRSTIMSGVGTVAYSSRN